MGADGAGVTAGDGPGERGVTVPERVVERGAEQRAQHSAGGLDADGAQQLHRLVHQRHEMVRADSESGVVERPHVLVDPDRLGAHLDHERLGREPQLLRRGDTEAGAGQPLQVDVGAGERHDRVQGERQGTAGEQGVEDAVAVGSTRVGDERARSDGGRSREAADEVGEDVVRDAEQQQVGPAGDGVRRKDRRLRDEALGPFAARARDRGDRDRMVPGARERSRQHRTDAAGADGADGEPGGPVAGRSCAHSKRCSSPCGYRTPPRYRASGAARDHCAMAGWRTWRVAMQDALYGADGFYRAAGTPRRHFRTAAHVSTAWSAALHVLLRRVADGLGDVPAFTVVDMGAGGGELLGALAARVPEQWRLVGVDVAPRPSGLPARVEWTDALPAAFEGALLAMEWLDVVPVDVVESTDEGPRLVEVDAGGHERLAGPPAAADAAWLAEWWPPAEPGDRAEIGRSRDLAWSDAVSRLRGGVALAVDYAAVPDRDVAGTLTGFRDGRQTLPVPDGSCDITAHVLMESCAAAVKADETCQLTQREALTALGVTARVPAYSGDAAGYLAELSRVGDAAELLDLSGLGGFTWLLHTKGMRGSPL